MSISILKFINKTKTDEQIDNIQESVANSLNVIISKINRKVNRSLTVVDVNGGKPELIKRDLTDILLYLDELKNLASDLESDARL